MVVYLVISETGDGNVNRFDTAINSGVTKFYDSNYSRFSREIKELSELWQDFNSNSTDGWLHFQFGIDIWDNQQDARLFYLIDRDPINGILNVVMELRGINGNLQLFQRIGASMVSVGASQRPPTDVDQPIDVHWRLSTSDGLAEWYLNDVLMARSTASWGSTLFQKINQLRIYDHRGGIETFRYPFMSQIVAANEPTLGWHVATMVPNGEGNSTQWSSPLLTKVDSVNQAGKGNGSKYINAGSTNLVNLWTLGSLSTITELFDIKAVGVVARLNRGSSGPQNVNIAIRTGGSDFFGPDVDIDLQYKGVFNVWDTNPNTSTTWASTDLTVLEIGVRSRT